jgi:hypothetical protein
MLGGLAFIETGPMVQRVPFEILAVAGILGSGAALAYAGLWPAREASADRPDDLAIARPLRSLRSWHARTSR